MLAALKQKLYHLINLPNQSYQMCYRKRTDGKCPLGINPLVWQETDKAVPDGSQVAFYV